MKPTDNLKIRYCDQCSKNVFWAESNVTAQAHARLGRCVALPTLIGIRMGGIMMDPPEHYLRLMFDWGRGFLWPARSWTEEKLGEGPLEDRLPLMPETMQRLRLLANWHLQSLHPTDTSKPGSWTADTTMSFEEAAADALEMVQNDLGSRYAVELTLL